MKRPVVKKLLSIILAAAILVSLNATPAAVWAAELERPVTITDTATYINPAYAHLEAPVSDGAKVADTGETYTAANSQEAAEILRELMAARTESATIRFPVDIVYDAENKDAFWAEVWAEEKSIFAAAVAHTGNPLEGDYIRYNYYKRSMTAGASFGETTTISIDYTFTYHASAEQDQAVTEVIDAFIEEYGLAGITDPAADIEKFIIAYDWLCGKTTYSDPIEAAPSTNYSSYGAVVEGDCVCQGYAVTLYRLLLELGVDCRVISGTDGDGGNHAWNIVKLNGLYYNTDATWDDSWEEAGVEWAWNLKCDANFPDHIRDAEFATESFYAAYPMASADYADSTGGTCGENATWSLENGVLTISGTGSMTNYIETSEVPWYAYAQSISAVEICSGITSVGQYAFSLLPALQTVSIADTVDTIWNYAFQSSGYLYQVNFAEGLTDIYVGAFEGCAALTDVQLPESLESICEYAFADSGLQQVTIPANVTMVSDYAFSGCAALTTVTFEGNAPDYLGDNAFQNVASTVYYPANDETWTEDIMQQYGGTLTWEAYETEDDSLFDLDGANLTLGDGLDMNFFMEPQKVAEGYYAVITRTYADGRNDHVVTVPYAEWNSMMGEVFYVTYTGIAAKEMGDTVSVVIYNASGEAVSKPWNDSVQAYAVRMLNDNPTEKLQTLLVDMLNYGAEAQTYFGYNTDNLVTDVLTDTQKACATASYETESKLVSGTGRAGAALTLKNRITLDFIFKNGAIGSDYTGLYAIATYTDHYGDTVETRIDTIKVFSDSYGYVSVPGLAVADYGQAVTCTVYDAEGNVLAWATDSIEGYAHRMRGHLPEMVEAIVKFGMSAYNYFHT